jgi:uncharacterized protein (DUF983 family)
MATLRGGFGGDGKFRGDTSQSMPVFDDKQRSAENQVLMLAVLTIVAAAVSMIALIDINVTHRLPGWVQWMLWTPVWLLLIANSTGLLQT